MEDRDNKGKFVKGNSGKPKGTKNRFTITNSKYFFVEISLLMVKTLRENGFDTNEFDNVIGKFFNRGQIEKLNSYILSDEHVSKNLKSFGIKPTKEHIEEKRLQLKIKRRMQKLKQLNPQL